MHDPDKAYLIVLLILSDSRQLYLVWAESCTVHCFAEHLQADINASFWCWCHLLSFLPDQTVLLGPT